MLKKIQYLALTVLLAGFVFTTGNALAAGSACGDHGQGKCKVSCGPYDEVISSNACIIENRDVMGYKESAEQCCIPTTCSFNNIGIGECKTGSCGSGYVGMNTSDCLSPKICCVNPIGKPGSQVNPNPTTVSPGNITTEGDNSSEKSWAGLVPCQGADCTLCDFLKFLQNLITYFTELIFALAGGFIVWGAVEIMTSGGSEERVKEGKNRVTIAITGIAIALAAWLFIGTVFQLLTNSSSKIPWNEIECSSK